MSDLFDKAKDLLGQNRDTVDDVVDKLADVVDGTTGGKHKDQISQGAEKAKDAIASFVGDDGPKPRSKQHHPAEHPPEKPEKPARKAPKPRGDA